MNIISIAMRNLNRQKKRSFLLGGAIAFGIFVITMINGFTGSFVENVSENFSHLFAGHIFIDGVEKTASGKTISIIRDDSKILEAIRRQEEIRLEEGECEAGIERMAAQTGQPGEVLRGALQQGGMAQFEAKLLEDKTIAWLLDGAEVVAEGQPAR